MVTRDACFVDVLHKLRTELVVGFILALLSGCITADYPMRA